MKNIIIFIYVSLLLLLQGCSHDQFRSYLLDDKPDRSIDQYQRNLAAKDIPVALLARNYSATTTDKSMILMSRAYNPPLNINDILNNTDNEVVLHLAKKNIEFFYITAHYLRVNKMEQDLELMAEVAIEYLDKKIDPLLVSNVSSQSSDIRKAVAELKYIKAHLLYEINEFEHACDAVFELEGSYHHEETAQLGILGEKLSIYRNPYLIMSDFSYMCDQK
ncbi:MAG: hypothetical protein JSW20_00910 [Nitrospiraceae bacterium]|nr:MAG: hypothetical protein JSW20_00910 [Nitrospiraceae bacterium]